MITTIRRMIAAAAAQTPMITPVGVLFCSSSLIVLSTSTKKLLNLKFTNT